MAFTETERSRLPRAEWLEPASTVVSSWANGKLRVWSKRRRHSPRYSLYTPLSRATAANLFAQPTLANLGTGVQPSNSIGDGLCMQIDGQCADAALKSPSVEYRTFTVPALMSPGVALKRMLPVTAASLFKHCRLCIVPSRACRSAPRRCKKRDAAQAAAAVNAIPEKSKAKTSVIPQVMVEEKCLWANEGRPTWPPIKVGLVLSLINPRDSPLVVVAHSWRRSNQVMVAGVK
jgi:hypothetical protein